ncbi:hypothetical protein FNV43_RR18300 [Rhamnella rubrinervis]|uniref:Uncharacterized protein n=1 Tax=Rhamnella rubrinervis TaxID=2594499 RepID=A0A8K0GST0_9ROSA|nr:hypothetical protein FNV43_RR18300 [Rhamnella rubrinervis]
MSITHYLLLFFLLCFYLHACNARRLGAIDDKKPEEKLHFSTKVEDKNGVDNGITVGPNVKSFSENERLTKGDSTAVTRTVQAEDHTREVKDTKVLPNIPSKLEKGQSTTSATVGSERRVSVSWPVPHKKRGEEQPGFNLDYSPPKTHPPSHN